MAANVICFASSKGGSGKTTITATLGTFLRETGKRVLMIDCDEGTHGLTLMYLSEVNDHRKMSNLPVSGIFDTNDEWPPELVERSLIELSKGLFFLPARHSFTETSFLSDANSFGQNLEAVLHYSIDKFDYILLDAQAGISSASRLVMSPSLSDSVILVSEYDPMSNAGIERLKARLPDELDVGRTWILLNKLLPEFVSKFSEFLSVAKYLPPVPWTADVVRAYSRRKLALDFRGGNQFTLAILNIVRELTPDAEREQLENWVSEQTARLREPIERQIEDAELLLKEVREQETRPLHVLELNRALTRSLVSVAPFALAILGLLAGLSSVVGTADPITQYFQKYFPELGVDMVLIGVSITFVVSFMFERLSRTVKDELSLRDESREEQRREINALRNRIKELSELASADYEGLIQHDKD